MSISLKKIETFEVVLKTQKDFSFADILCSEEVDDKDLKIKGKHVSFRVIEKRGGTIVGIVETSRNENIPPKKIKRTKKVEKLGLEEGDGLAYANIFIFEKKRNILMYEVNKFGCFVDHFLVYLYKCCKRSEVFQQFHVTLNPVLKANEYQRMLQMPFHKSLYMEIANPKEIIENYRNKNDAIWNNCIAADSVGSTRVKTTFEVEANKNSTGLMSRSLRSIVDSLLTLARGPKSENIKKILVRGYESDSDNGPLQTIDLIADRLVSKIKLEEPRENNDLLEQQRKSEIKRVYQEKVAELDSIFGK